MRTAGVICEYDPFHLGHQKQLRLLRQALGEDSAVVCVMSGRFVQRGVPAVFPPSVRAAAAVCCGASLVLELPTTYSLRSAEGFARGSVEVLEALGVVDVLGFGCECGDGGLLQKTADILCSDEYSLLLRQRLQDGLSYPAARQSALEALGADGSVLRSPNDILAVEYCKALLELGSRMEPLAIRREGDFHAPLPDADNPSATAIRALLPHGAWQSFVPEDARPFYENAPYHSRGFGQRAMLARLRGMSRQEWEQTAHGSEGLWSKVYKAVQTEDSIEAILAAAKSKRYPLTRLQRLLLCAYLGIDRQTLLAPAPYVRILAFDEKGRALLRRIGTGSSIPLLHSGQTPPSRSEAQREQRYAGLYALFARDFPCPAGKTGEKTFVFQREK